MADGEHVPQHQPLTLAHRLHCRRLMRFYAEEAEALEAEGDKGGAKIYRQGAESVRQWVES